jgi:hypothetical protein
MPDMKIPNTDINKIAADLKLAVQEAAYMAVGLALLAVQRAQVRRVELSKQVEELIAQLRVASAQLGAQRDEAVAAGREQTASTRAQLAGQLSDLSNSLEATITPIRQQVARALPSTGAELPQMSDLAAQLKGAAQQFQTRLEAVRPQLGDLGKAVDERVGPARTQFDEQFDVLVQRLLAALRMLLQYLQGALSRPEPTYPSANGDDPAV